MGAAGPIIQKILMPPIIPGMDSGGKGGEGGGGASPGGAGMDLASQPLSMLGPMNPMGLALKALQR